MITYLSAIAAVIISILLGGLLNWFFATRHWGPIIRHNDRVIRRQDGVIERLTEDKDTCLNLLNETREAFQRFRAVANGEIDNLCLIVVQLSRQIDMMEQQNGSKYIVDDADVERYRQRILPILEERAQRAVQNGSVNITVNDGDVSIDGDVAGRDMIK